MTMAARNGRGHGEDLGSQSHDGRRRTARAVARRAPWACAGAIVVWACAAVASAQAPAPPASLAGIDEAEARRLVVHGFFNDIVRKIGVPELEESLLTAVEAELEKNVTAEVRA